MALQSYLNSRLLTNQLLDTRYHEQSLDSPTDRIFYRYLYYYFINN